MANEIIKPKTVDTTTGEILGATVPANDILDANDVLQGSGSAQIFSLNGDPDNALDQLEAIEIFGGEAKALKEAVNKSLKVVNAAFGEVEVNDSATKQIRKSLRMVILTDKGEKFSTESKSATLKFGQYHKIFKDSGLVESVDTPLPIEIQLLKSRGGNDVLDLKIDRKIFESYLK